jgi:hypothetical protein
MTKSLLSKLNITEAPLKHPADPFIQRQNKLIAKLEVRREMAQCLVESKKLKTYRFKYFTDPGIGIKNKVRAPNKLSRGSIKWTCNTLQQSNMTIRAWS